MESKDQKEDRTEEITKFWNSFAKSYEEFQEAGSMQASIVLYNFCLPRTFTQLTSTEYKIETRSPTKIIEVGVGPGKAARSFISTFMQPGNVYVCGDISPEMIELFMQNFQDSDLSYSPKIKLQKLDSSLAYNPETLITSEADSKTIKNVFAIECNNECLPFEDSSFDCYIANLSLMIVNDYKMQLSEAYRVLESGGVAGFTVWGRQENTQFFTLMPEIFERNGVKTPQAKHTTNNFHLNNKEKLEKDLKDAGFLHPKLFYAPNNKPYFDAVSLFEHIVGGPSTKLILDSITPELAEQIKQDFIAEFNTRFGPESCDPLTFEVLVAIAWK